MHQVVACGQVLIEGDPAHAQVGVIAFPILQRKRQVDAAAVQVAAEQVRQLGPGMGGGIQLLDQFGVQHEPVDVLLGQAGGVQEDVGLADALHFRDGVDVSDAVVAGGVVHLVLFDLLGQRRHGLGLQPGHVLGGVVLGGLGVRRRHQLGDFIVAHGRLYVGQLLLQGFVTSLLCAGLGPGGHQRGGLAVLQPAAGHIGVHAVPVPLVHFEQAVLVVLEIPAVAAVGVSADHIRDDAHGVAALPDQPGGYGQRGGHGIHQRLGEAFLCHLRDFLVHDGLEGVRVAGVHIRGSEHDGVLGALHLDVGAKAAVGDGRLEPLLVIGGVDREEIGHGVQRQLVRQNLLQAGADESVPDH